ncbi:MAG: penicillin-binding protein 2 [Nocardioidaceae bacterium]|nr:penicillin-binding protein 2 [Nocardioidaceae bacterium]
MNKPIRTLAVGCFALFAMLLINLNYVQVLRAGDLNDDSANKRVRDAECSRERGAILVGGDPVARSVPSNDNLKFVRKFTKPELYAPVTGYFSCIYGTSGIESSENAVLSGSDERLFVNRVIDMVGNKQPKGGSVLLTIDPRAQQAALDGLNRLPGDTRGAVVALDPTKGAILAMVSKPTYDPNFIATHDTSVAEANWKRLTTDDPMKKMTNRASQEIYPPGSTFKLVVAAAALSNGYSPDSTVKGGTTLDLPQSSATLTNEGGSDCGGSEITLTQALAVSCNVSFGDLGLKLGAQTLQDQAEKFGFNEDYFDQLSSAESRFPTEMDEPSTALSSIGQFDVAASPLQMAMVTAGIANGGAVMRPYVVQEVRSPGLDVLDEADPEVLHQAISGSVADELTQMMVEVVETGTADEVKMPGISVAGKTGTANSSEEKSPYAWMVSFAPADDPQVAVAVFIEQTDVPRPDISGGGLAGPIAKGVMQAVIGR